MRLALVALLVALPTHAEAIRVGARADRAVMIAPVAASGSTVTLDAMPYARTVACRVIQVTGTYTGSAPTGWTASPSGASGSCSDLGLGQFECNVDVNPDATGEGVETITVGDQSVTIGFYVDGAHSCFLSQDTDGNYNATMADLDAISAIFNGGSSGLEVNQSTGAAQPTFRTGIVGDQPMIRCDGGDRVSASTASDWTFLNNSADWSSEVLFSTSSRDPNALVIPVATATSISAAVRGASIYLDDRAASARNNRVGFYSANGTSQIYDAISADNAITSGAFNVHGLVQDDDGGAGNDLTLFGNYVSLGSLGAGTYSALAPTGALTICAEADGGSNLTGDVFRVLIYQSALTATQRGINEAVDEWALGGSLPVSPPIYHLDSSDSATITTAGGSVSSWRSTGLLTGSFTGANNPASTVSGSSSQLDFDGTNDSLSLAAQTSTANSHTFAVVTVDSIATNGTGATCNANDTIFGYAGDDGLRLRTAGGIAYVIGHNLDGTNDCAETTFSLSTKVILEYKVDGTNVSVAVNGGAFTSVASGSTSTGAAAADVGIRSTDFYDGKIHEILRYGDDLDTTARNAVIAELQTKWGL